MKKISDIALSIAPSATLAIDALAKQMKAEGINVAAFGAGEPDFATPEYIKQAGIQAIIDNKTTYTPAAGTLTLRQAICSFLESSYGLTYKPTQIVVSSGAKHSIFVALHAVCDPGDEVILPAPYWVSYYEAIKSCGAVPVVIDTTEEDRFKLTAETLRKAITPRTKMLILCNPSNPTGMLYSKSELEALSQVIIENDLYVMCDEIYSALVYQGEFTCLATLSPEMQERTIMIRGVSKAFAMTGWRVGYAAANDQIAKAMTSYQSHSTGAPGTMCQYAAEASYTGDQSATDAMREAFGERRKYFLERVAKIPGVTCLDPDGAFYIFMNIKQQLGRTFFGEKVLTSDQFAQNLLKNALVAVVPGSAFGAEGYLRWSYATGIDNIELGLSRLEKFIADGQD